MEIKLHVRILTLGGIRRIRAQLNHCARNTLRTFAESSRMRVGAELIQKLFADRKCQGEVQRTKRGPPRTWPDDGESTTELSPR